MNIVGRVRRRLTRIAENAGVRTRPPELGSFSVPPEERARLRADPPTPVHRAFFDPGKRVAHKWAHYLDVYHRYLDGLRGRPIHMLEIGVLGGGSLDMWRRYFGDAATIVGVDIDPACAGRVDAPNVVRIGSQADRAFLEGVVAEFGAPDLVLDDGSHVAEHQRKSFEILFPLLKDGGLYIIEDAHTSYWNDWDGGYRRRGTAIEEAKRLVDDLHAWYHGRTGGVRAHETIDAIHFHDSVIVIEKKSGGRPGMLPSNEAV